MSKLLGKITIAMKNPDCVGNAVDEFVRDSLPANMDKDEREALEEVRKEKVNKALSKFVEWSEYITVRIDLDNGTAEVVPA